MNKATVITGKGGVLYTNTNGYIFDKISYLDSTGNSISIKSISDIGNEETLYLASVLYDNNGTTVTGLTNNYCLDNSYNSRVSCVPSKISSSSVFLNVQGFGSDKITLFNQTDLVSQILKSGFEYILTNSSNPISWNPSHSGVIIQPDYYFYIDPRDVGSDGVVDYDAYYFTVDNSAGVGFFTNKSTYLIERCSKPIELFIHRRPKSDDVIDNSFYKEWSNCGSVLWSPIDLNPTVNWHI